MVEGFKRMASLTNDQLKTFGNNSLSFAKQYLTREINLRMVCDAIEKEIS
jgi:hypothetical protein